MIYTGIGSRSTPPAVCSAMKDIARQLAIRGYILRSGGAEGADTAFEQGCEQGFGSKEIYTPWYGFNGNYSKLCHPSEHSYEIAARLLGERWEYMRWPVRRLQARNIHQVLGQDLELVSQLLICWTPNGAEVGGTATALRLAVINQIPIINMAQAGAKEQLHKLGVI